MGDNKENLEAGSQRTSQASTSKTTEPKNIDLKFFGNHVHIDSEGKETRYKAGDTAKFTQAEADAIRKNGVARLDGVALKDGVEIAGQSAASAVPSATGAAVTATPTTNSAK